MSIRGHKIVQGIVAICSRDEDSMPSGDGCNLEHVEGNLQQTKIKLATGAKLKPTINQNITSDRNCHFLQQKLKI